MGNNRADDNLHHAAGEAEAATAIPADDGNAKIVHPAGAIYHAAEKVKQSAGEILQNTASAAETVQARLHDAAHDIGAQASQVGGQVYQQTVQAGHYAGEQIKQRPVAAMMIAGVLGGIIGYFIGHAAQAESLTPRAYAARLISRRYR
jgi:ElaB/YqjD/DUF883 family membrane-anchored ribosome-binding protein